MPAASPPVMKAVPPPLMVPTTVAVLAAAASGCDASIATASEMAGTRLRSFLIMSLFPPVIASECSAREKPVAAVRPVPSQQRGVQLESRDVPTRCSPPPSLDHAVRPPDVANKRRIRSPLRSYAVRLQRRPLVAGTKTRTSGSRLSATHQECAREHFLSRSPEFLGNGGVFHIGSNQRERSAAGFS